MRRRVTLSPRSWREVHVERQRYKGTWAAWSGWMEVLVSPFDCVSHLLKLWRLAVGLSVSPWPHWYCSLQLFEVDKHGAKPKLPFTLHLAIHGTKISYSATQWMYLHSAHALTYFYSTHARTHAHHALLPCGKQLVITTHSASRSHSAPQECLRQTLTMPYKVNRQYLTSGC